MEIDSRNMNGAIFWKVTKYIFVWSMLTNVANVVFFFQDALTNNEKMAAFVSNPAVNKQNKLSKSCLLAT